MLEIPKPYPNSRLGYRGSDLKPPMRHELKQSQYPSRGLQAKVPTFNQSHHAQNHKLLLTSSEVKLRSYLQALHLFIDG